jgi:hypothetical protein
MGIRFQEDVRLVLGRTLGNAANNCHCRSYILHEPERQNNEMMTRIS